MKLYALALISLGPCDRLLVHERPDAAPLATTAAPLPAPAPPSPLPGPTPTMHAAAPPAAPAPAPAAPTANPGGPRLGKYIMLTYGAKSVPIYLGRIDLQPGGHYGVSNTSTGPYYGEGSYSFDAAASRVVWLSGPMKDQGWTGDFTIEREGKTHKIRIKSSTIATNSTDS